MIFRAAGLAAVASLCATATAFAQADACTSAVPRPTDVSLTVTLAERRAVYRQGEIVPLRLDFTSTAPGRYFADTRNYDRSGRLMTDVVCLEPDAPDPLADYFGSGLFGFIGGGIGGQVELKSHQILLELNEWKSLPSGSYRLRVVSDRITRRASSSEAGQGVVPVRLASNAVDVRVVPADTAWQATALGAALKELDIDKTDPASVRHAARTLRFLGSEAAATELVERFHSLQQPNGWDLMFGLVASPYRSHVIRQMRSAITAPRHPITHDFLKTLALLEIQSDPAHRLPPYDKTDDPQWRGLLEARRASYERLLDGHIEELAAAVDGKLGEARVLSADTLLGSGPAGTAAARARARQALIGSWDSLPVRTRNELLQHRWSEIAGSEMLPILRRIVNGPPNVGRSAGALERGPALRRIYELSPGEGREGILREILEGAGDIGIDVLGLLPDAQIPQVEQPVLARLRGARAPDVDYHVIARYASRAAFSEVRALYEQHAGRWACSPQNAMLRYFLRIDPDYGARAVADALTRREVTGCYRMTLSGIGEALRASAVQKVALAALNDPSYEVVRDAAEALGKYGSAEAEPALWQRLEVFHAAWKGKEAQLRYVPGMKPDDLAPAAAESALVRAIVTGQAWRCTPEKREYLKQLVSPERRRDIDRMRMPQAYFFSGIKVTFT